METFITVCAVGVLIVLFIVWCIVIYDTLTPPKQAEPMVFEEEVKWLMEVSSLTREEAEEIAKL